MLLNQGHAVTALALALSAVVIGCPGPTAASKPGPASVCRQVVDHIRRLPSLAGETGWTDPIHRLADRKDALVQVDLTHGSAQEMDAVVAAFISDAERHQQASPSVVTAMKELDPQEGDLTLRRFGRSSLAAIEQDMGTMHCMSFVFLDAPTGGVVRVIAPPPQALAAITDGTLEPNSFCSDHWAFVGDVAGRPAFFDERFIGPYPDFPIVMSTWDGRSWAWPCLIDVSYRRSYRVGDVHCRGEVCKALTDAAPKLAARYDAEVQRHGGAPPQSFAWGPPPSLEAAAQAKRFTSLFEDTLFSQHEPMLDDPDDQAPHYEGDFVTFPLNLNGRGYFAVLGHESGRGITYPTMILGLYAFQDDKIIPVAGLEIEQQADAVARTSVKPWRRPKPSP